MRLNSHNRPLFIPNRCLSKRGDTSVIKETLQVSVQMKPVHNWATTSVKEGTDA